MLFIESGRAAGLQVGLVHAARVLALAGCRRDGIASTALSHGLRIHRRPAANSWQIAPLCRLGVVTRGQEPQILNQRRSSTGGDLAVGF